MKALHKKEVWEKVLKQSQTQPVLVFKHSNKCPASADAHQEIRALEQKSGFEDNMYITVVQRARDISDTIEEEMDIKHETPQVIMVYKREPVYEADHDEISADTISKELVRVKNEEGKK